jgi:hypothetical protein
MLKFIIAAALLMHPLQSFAGAYDDTVARSRDYYNSQEYRDSVERENQATANRITALIYKAARDFARSHRGMAVFSWPAGETAEFSTKDGWNCKLRSAPLLFNCIHSDTFAKMSIVIL